jgi:hypothetical protein
MTDFIGIDVEGIPELLEKLDKLPPEARDAAVDEVAPYLVNVFKLYPPYSYVKFKDAYVNWFSEKQRK